MMAGKYNNWKYLKIMNVYCPVFTMSCGRPPNNLIIEIIIVIFISQIKIESLLHLKLYPIQQGCKSFKIITTLKERIFICKSKKANHRDQS